jgi:DNA-binding NtrC family response regulator
VVIDYQENREGMMAKVLVVDDQACIRQLISKVLLLDEHEVHAIGNAQSVREYLVAFQPDIILLDLYLDGLEGINLLEQIKRQHPSLPVIVVTAYDSHRDDPRLRKADGYILKSVEFWDEMRQKVAEVLGRNQLVQPETKREITSPNPPQPR